MLHEIENNQDTQSFLKQNGKKFGRLTVLFIYKRGHKRYCECVCECGNKINTQLSNIKYGNTKSCGCLKIGAPAHNRIDRTGQKFNFWEILSYKHTVGKDAFYLCRCRCGKESIRDISAIVSGRAKSCGCYNNRGSHRKSHSRVYNIWSSMKRRCYAKSLPEYIYYGGIGVKVCDRWLKSFQNFYEDMGNPPTEKHTIDRFPNKAGNYEPGNCRWATMKEQSNNRKSNILVTINGETKNLTQWVDIFKIPYKTVWMRIKRGKDPIIALKTPV